MNATATTTVRLTIKGVDHTLSIDEAREVIKALNDAISPSIKNGPSLEEIWRQIPRTPTQPHYHQPPQWIPREPFRTPEITCKTS